MFEKALGVRPPALAETFGIIGLPLVYSRARFLAPVGFGDVVVLTSHVNEFRSARFGVEHRLMLGDMLSKAARRGSGRQATRPTHHGSSRWLFPNTSSRGFRLSENYRIFGCIAHIHLNRSADADMRAA